MRSKPVLPALVTSPCATGRASSNVAEDMGNRMYPLDPDTMLNRTTMPKPGAQVGEITLAFRER